MSQRINLSASYFTHFTQYTNLKTDSSQLSWVVYLLSVSKQEFGYKGLSSLKLILSCDRSLIVSVTLCLLPYGRLCFDILISLGLDAFMSLCFA